MKKSILLMAFAAAASGCSTIYSGSALTPDGGMYLSGQVNGQKTMFYCDSSVATSDCKKVNVTKK